VDHHHPAPSERSFGLSVGSVTALLSAYTWWRGYETAPAVLAAIAGLLIGGALVAPSLLRVPNRVWWRFAQVLGWVNTRVLLSAFFFLVLTPAGLIMRAVGRHPLRPSAPGTSWSPYPERRRSGRHYEQSF
jgi:hypothetical protein